MVVCNLTWPKIKITGRERAQTLNLSCKGEKASLIDVNLFFLFHPLMDIKDTTSTQLQVTDSFLYGRMKKHVSLLVGTQWHTVWSSAFFLYCQPFAIKKRAQAGVLYMKSTIESGLPTYTILHNILQLKSTFLNWMDPLVCNPSSELESNLSKSTPTGF